MSAVLRDERLLLPLTTQQLDTVLAIENAASLARRMASRSSVVCATLSRR